MKFMESKISVFALKYAIFIKLQDFTVMLWYDVAIGGCNIFCYGHGFYMIAYVIDFIKVNIDFWDSTLMYFSAVHCYFNQTLMKWNENWHESSV